MYNPNEISYSDFKVLINSSDNFFNEDIRAVLVDVLKEFRALIAMPPPMGNNPVEIIHRPEGPLIYLEPLSRNIYKIGLTVSDRYYVQAAYQFSHEMCHVYCDPSVTNWFIESICELSSLYFLGFISEKWINDAPYPFWQPMASQFRNYRNDILKGTNETFPIFGKELNEWFGENIPEMKSPYERDINTKIAIHLLPLFEDSKENWKLLPWLGQCDIRPEHSKPGEFVHGTGIDFIKLHSIVPDSLKNTVDWIRRELNH